MPMRAVFLLFGVALALPAADNWPGWRGPAANGISPMKDLPIRWDPARNIRWKTAVPGRGHSSPVVWGNRIFLTTDVEGEVVPGKVIPKHFVRGGVPFRNPDSRGADRKHTLSVLCYDADTGKQLWNESLTTARYMTRFTRPIHTHRRLR